MFTSLSPVAVRITAVLLTFAVGCIALYGTFYAGRLLGAQEQRAQQLAANLAAEISLSKRQKFVLDTASRQNQKLVEDLWREIGSFSGRLSSIRAEVQNLPSIEELNCAPGPDRVDVVNRTLGQ